MKAKVVIFGIEVSIGIGRCLNESIGIGQPVGTTNPPLVIEEHFVEFLCLFCKMMFDKLEREMRYIVREASIMSEIHHKERIFLVDCSKHEGIGERVGLFNPFRFIIRKNAILIFLNIPITIFIRILMKSVTNPVRIQMANH